jgi:outer membrane receptor protein involved in Fe transport
MNQIGMINITRPSFTAMRSRSDNEFSGTASLTWRPTDDLTAYLKYAHGFKSGGFQFDITQGENATRFQSFITGAGNLAAVVGSLTTALGRAPTKNEIIAEVIVRSADPNTAPASISFEPETVNVYEGGVKAVMFDGRARVNLAGYYTDYNDRQQGITRLATGIVVFNVPNSQVWGFEFDTDIDLTDELNFSGGVGTAFSRINSGVPIADNFGGIEEIAGDEFIGQRFPSAPEVTANASLTYQRQITESGDMVLKFDWSYTGSILHELAEGGSRIEDIVSEDSFNLLNARLGYVSEEDAWEVFFWVRNLTNERYAGFRRFNPIIRTFGLDANGNGIGAFPGDGTAQALFGPPRMWGVTFQKQF